MTGINVITYYQTIMYNALGITGNRNTLVVGIYNCVGPLTNLIFVVFILDRVGRRKPMLFGSIAISIALICEAVLNSQNPNGDRIGYSMGGVFFLFAVSVIFSLSFGPCSWCDRSLSILFVILCFNYLSLTRSQGVHGRGHANADSRQGKCICSRDWQLGGQYIVESGLTYRTGSNPMAVLFCFCGVE